MATRRLVLVCAKRACRMCERDMLGGDGGAAQRIWTAREVVAWQRWDASRTCGRSFATGASAASPRGPVSYVSLILTAATGAGLLALYNYLMAEKLHGGAQPEAVAGKAMVGGPFQLLDQDGRPFSDRDLLGKWALLYFGFTSCPDICPDELDKMTEALNLMGKETSAAIQPVFISVDPDRDSVPQVSKYIREFHPRLIGLTGGVEEVKAAAKAYRVYYTKSGDDDDYLVDHSIIMYLVNPDGGFVTFYGKNFDAPSLAKSLEGHLASWEGRKRNPQNQTPA